MICEIEFSDTNVDDTKKTKITLLVEFNSVEYLYVDDRVVVDVARERRTGPNQHSASTNWPCDST